MTVTFLIYHFLFAVSLGKWASNMSEKFRLDRKIGLQNTFYTKCINVIIDSIGPSIILRSIFIQLMYNKKRPSCKVVHFCQMIDVFAYITPSPPDPRRPLHVLYIYIMTSNCHNCQKGILSLGGGGSI